MMKARIGVLSGAVALMALVALPPLAHSSTFLPADLTADLTADHVGDDLGARVEVVLVDPATAVLRLQNTSANVSPLPEGPLLGRVGFNLAGDPGPACLILDDPAQRFTLLSPAAPFCGGKHTFRYELFAPTAPLWTTEVVEVALRVEPACQGTFAFTHETFLGATPAQVGVLPGRLGAALSEVAGEPQPICLRGDPTLAVPALHFTWATFLANAAEVRTSTSVFGEGDSRAGSLAIVLAGDSGLDGVTTDPPLEAAVITLRNGAGAILEQQHVNRRWVPDTLDANACLIDDGPPACFVSWPDDGAGGMLVAGVPTMVADSNADFDLVGKRVTVAGSLSLDYTMEPFTDCGHEMIRITWARDGSLRMAQLMLRAGYDANLDGSTVDEPMVTLFARNDPTLPGGVFDPSLHVVSVTKTSLSIEVDVEAALHSIRAAYVKAGIL